MQLKSLAARKYAQQQKQPNADQRVTQFLPMVHKLVSKVTSYLQPPLTRDDLVSAGTIGLIKAAHDYDSTKNAEFQTYAYIRIRGAIIDELRSWSFAPPSLNKQLQEAQTIHDEVMAHTGHSPSDEEVAKKMGIGVDKLYKTYEQGRARYFLSMSGYTEDEPALANVLAGSESGQPEQRIEREELVHDLADAIERLPQKQRQIVILYYQQELTMKEIAEVLEITESRVSQLHSSAVFKLGSLLKDHDNAR
ncbi:Sigma-28 [Anaerohalosphaera lusitana]|uniref:RNA polymerase sigma factor n=2 Tax=Anaerohalosphaera lusitana TaxID=1936003 RepID=A0A1U9NGK4_9BACT|nr:Sigma-28 [Anaerohalosphaera lusitana]